jgi:hypothetical protein
VAIIDNLDHALPNLKWLLEANQHASGIRIVSILHQFEDGNCLAAD